MVPGERGVMAKFRKKPVEIQAIQYTGSKESVAEVLRFCPDAGLVHSNICIRTLEGTMFAIPNYWIIKGVQGEFYPCKPDIFEATYEPAD